MELVLMGLVLFCLVLAVVSVIIWLKFSTIRNLNSTRAAQMRAMDSEAGETVQTRLRQLEQRIKAVEMEWENTYAQLKRTLGRVVKEKGLDKPDPTIVDAETPPTPLTRADVLRRSRAHE